MTIPRLEAMVNTRSRTSVGLALKNLPMLVKALLKERSRVDQILALPEIQGFIAAFDAREARVAKEAAEKLLKQKKAAAAAEAKREAERTKILAAAAAEEAREAEKAARKASKG